MTVASHDLEHQVAEAVTAPARVLVVAYTQSVGATMLDEMQSDNTVRGSMAKSTLTEALEDQSHKWSDLNFVVFELSKDPEQDMESVRRLKARSDCALHCIVMVRETAGADLRAQLLEAGAAEIIALPSRQAVVTTAAEVIPEPSTEALQDEAARIAPVAQAGPQMASDLTAEPERAVIAQPQPDASAEEDAAVFSPEASAQDYKGRVTVLLRARGGAGATTLAVNLAAAQAAKTGPGRVALLDLDIQNGAVALAMDLADSVEASALVTGDVQPNKTFIDRAMVRHSSGVDVLTAPDIFAPLDALDPHIVAALIDGLKERYDLVIVDMPQAVTDWTLPVLGAASQVVVITDTSLPSVKRTRRLIDLIGEEHMTLPVDVIVNQQQKPLRMSAALRECEALIGRPLQNWIPLDSKTARRANDLGIPLQISAKRSRMARAIAALAARLFEPKTRVQ